MSMSCTEPSITSNDMDRDVLLTPDDSQDISPPPAIHRTHTMTPSSLKKLLLNSCSKTAEVAATEVAADSLCGSPNHPASESDVSRRSPSASTYYCSGSLPRRNLPSASPASAAISASLPCRRATGSLPSSSLAPPSAGGCIPMGGHHHVRVASQSFLGSLVHTQPRLQPPLCSRPAANALPALPSVLMRGGESGFAHFVNSERVHHQLPQTLGADGRGPVKASFPWVAALPSAAQVHLRSGLNSPFGGSLPTTSVLLPEQDASSDDLFTCKEFIAFLNGTEEPASAGAGLSAAPPGLDAANPFVPSAKDISIALCSSCDLSFSDSATAFASGNIFDAEAAKTFSRDGAKRAATVRVLM